MPITTPHRSAEAFAPAHVTGLFAPRLAADDPRARGSVGAGLVLALGVAVRARIEPAARPSVRLRSDVGGALPISREVARRQLRDRPGRLVVEVEHALPVGQGFGMSAAGALATALATGAVLGIPRARSVAVAHLAELFGRGGLGGVAAILGGGLEVRREAGLPPWGRVVYRSFRRPIVLVVTGRPMPSPTLLGDSEFRRRIDRAAAAGLRRLGGRPDADRFLAESERFTDGLGLADDRLRKTIDALRGPDVRVSQAMFGRSLFAVPRTQEAHGRLLDALARLHLSPIMTTASPEGATVLALPSKHF
jgi:pantoate kinase